MAIWLSTLTNEGDVIREFTLSYGQSHKGDELLQNLGVELALNIKLIGREKHIE